MRETMRHDFAPDSTDLDGIAHVFAELAVGAGAAVMDIYGGDVHARAKVDDSPVCDADLAAEDVILKGLAARLPHLPVVSEEAVAAGAKFEPCDAFILVDPLDGTREFLAKNGEFTINLALIHNGVPVAGVVYAPALEEIWIAGRKAVLARVPPGGALPALRKPLHARHADENGLVALVSRSHDTPETEAFLAGLPIKETLFAGSSLKFCKIAEGVADVYPRFGPTMEWDTAAGDAVLRRAGGTVRDQSGSLLAYGKFAEQLKNNGFVAFGDPLLADRFTGAKTA
jgi:3'(2'), 5'-bisphosphate nucleotidase